ncbi:MAG: hypothetical protein ACQET1_09705 [Gemmatimonadota bacterium]
MPEDAPAEDIRIVPRIRPTEAWLRAIEGVWELRGDRFWLGEDPDTGALQAVGEGGDRVNPIQVISRGRRLSKF